MEILVLWQKLRKQQITKRNTRIYQQFDKKFLQDLVASITNYNNTILKYAGLPDTTNLLLNNQSISQQKNLNQLQKTLLHHVTAVNRLNNMIIELLQSANCDNNGCTVINPKTIINNLPRASIADQFAADRVKRYGEYLAQLQILQPQVFRASNIIINHARNQLALNIFYSIRSIAPKLFTSQGISNEFAALLRDVLDKSHTETEHISKHKNVFLYLKQRSKDSGFNLLLDLLQSINLDKYVARELANFIIKRTDNVKTSSLELKALELTDLNTYTDTNITSQLFSNYVQQIKSRRFIEIKVLLDKATLLDINNQDDKQELKNILTQINLLTPFEQTYRVPLKDEQPIQNNMLFNHLTVNHLINKIKIHLDYSNTKPNEIHILLQLLQNKLTYNTKVINTECQKILGNVDRKIKLAKRYPINEQLFNTINNLNILIANHTKINVFGTHKKDKTAKQANNYRRELMLLMRDRITIALNNTPVPNTANWGEFLANEIKAPLSYNEKWWNGFFVFTPLGTNPRFPGLLSEQLLRLHDIKNLSASLKSLLKNNYNTIPKIDKKEPSPSQIIGTKHLTEPLNRLEHKQKQLISYITFLQFASINCILDQQLKLQPSTESKYSQKISNINNNLKAWLTFLQRQAEDNGVNSKNMHLPIDQAYKRLIKAFTNLNTDVEHSDKKVPTTELNKIIDNLNKLNMFFNGNKQQINACLNTKSTPINMRQLNILRKLIVCILEFHQHRLRHGFVHSVNKLFSYNRHCAPVVNGLSQNKLTKIQIKT